MSCETDEELDMQLSRESKTALREYLSIYDTNKDGVINSEELGNYLREMGMCISDEGVRFLKRSFDKNGDGKLQIDEVIENMETINTLAITDEDLIDAFKIIDKNGNGFIRLQELRAILTHGGENSMSSEEASTLLEELMVYDKNHDGKFSYQEFVDMFMNSAFPFKKPKHVKNHEASFKMQKVLEKKPVSSVDADPDASSHKKASSEKRAKSKSSAGKGSTAARKT